MQKSLDFWVKRAALWTFFGLLGLLLTGLGNEGRAQSVPELLDSGVKKYNTGKHALALEDFKQILLQNPKHAEALHLAGRAYGRIGNLKEAKKHLKRSLRYDKSNPDYQFHYAIFWADKGKLKKSERQFKKVLKMDAQYDAAWYNIGMLKFRRGKFDEAIESFDQAVDIDPLDAENFLQRGNTYLASGRFDEAIPDYEMAVQVDPNCAEAFYNAGVAKQGMGQNYEAMKAYTASIDLDSLDPDAFLNRGVILRRMGLAPEALRDFERAAAIDSSDVRALFNIAILKQYEMNDKETAFEIWHKIIELEPKDAEARYHRAKLHFEHGDFDDAMADIDVALKYAKDSPAANHLKGKLLLQKGDEKGAEKYQKRAEAYKQ